MLLSNFVICNSREALESFSSFLSLQHTLDICLSFSSEDKKNRKVSWQ